MILFRKTKFIKSADFDILVSNSCAYYVICSGSCNHYTQKLHYRFSASPEKTIKVNVGRRNDKEREIRIKEIKIE